MKAIETLIIRFIKFSVVCSVLIIAYIGTSFVGLTPAVLIFDQNFPQTQSRRGFRLPILHTGYLKFGKKHGIWTYYDYSLEVSFTMSFNENVKDGQSKKFNGKKISSIGHWKNDKRNGEWKFYSANGKLKQILNYKDGKEQGNFAEYYPDGKLKFDGYIQSNDGDSLLNYYYQNGQLAETKVKKKYQKDGKQKTYFKNGELESLKLYNKGQPIQTESVYTRKAKQVITSLTDQYEVWFVAVQLPFNETREIDYSDKRGRNTSRSYTSLTVDLAEASEHQIVLLLNSSENVKWTIKNRAKVKLAYIIHDSFGLKNAVNSELPSEKILSIKSLIWKDFNTYCTDNILPLAEVDVYSLAVTNQKINNLFHARSPRSIRLPAQTISTDLRETILRDEKNMRDLKKCNSNQ